MDETTVFAFVMLATTMCAGMSAPVIGMIFGSIVGLMVGGIIQIIKVIDSSGTKKEAQSTTQAEKSIKKCRKTCLRIRVVVPFSTRDSSLVGSTGKI